MCNWLYILFDGTSPRYLSLFWSYLGNKLKGKGFNLFYQSIYWLAASIWKVLVFASIYINQFWKLINCFPVEGPSAWPNQFWELIYCFLWWMQGSLPDNFWKRKRTIPSNFNNIFLIILKQVYRGDISLVGCPWILQIFGSLQDICL